MISFSPQSIAHMARDLFHRSDERRVVRAMHPKRDWLMGLVIGILILLGIMAWSAVMYLSNRSGEQIPTAEVAAPSTMYRAAVVADALELFAEKDEIFQSLQSGVLVPASVPVVTPPVATGTPATTTESSTETTEPSPATTTEAAPAPESADTDTAEPESGTPPRDAGAPTLTQ